jgi:hypothetical protein
MLGFQRCVRKRLLHATGGITLSFSGRGFLRFAGSVTTQPLPLDDSPEGFWEHSRSEKLGIVIPREREAE